MDGWIFKVRCEKPNTKYNERTSLQTATEKLKNTQASTLERKENSIKKMNKTNDIAL